MEEARGFREDNSHLDALHVVVIHPSCTLRSLQTSNYLIHSLCGSQDSSWHLEGWVELCGNGGPVPILWGPRSCPRPYASTYIVAVGEGRGEGPDLFKTRVKILHFVSVNASL